MGVKWLHENSDFKLVIFKMKSNDINVFRLYLSGLLRRILCLAFIHFLQVAIDHTKYFNF